MTKLYHGAEGWQIPGQQEKKAKRVDVPSSPAELAAWLNARRVPRGTYPEELTATDATQFPTEHKADVQLAPQVPPPPSSASAVTVQMIEEFILDVATTGQVEALLARIGTRFAELRKAQPAPTAATVKAWLASAEISQIRDVAEAIKIHTAELGRQLEDRSVQ